jgi:putative transposase
VIEDVTKECLAAVADTSISGRRVAREFDAILARRGKPELIVSGMRNRVHIERHARLVSTQPHRLAFQRAWQADAERDL